MLRLAVSCNVSIAEFSDFVVVAFASPFQYTGKRRPISFPFGKMKRSNPPRYNLVGGVLEGVEGAGRFAQHAKAVDTIELNSN